MMEEQESEIKIESEGTPGSECKEEESPKAEDRAELLNSTDSAKDAVQLSDAKGSGKKGKKSKQNWKNRFSKQKQQDSSENNLSRRPFHLNYNKFRTGRKRTQSFPAGSKFFLPYKRPRKESFIPPTKFLLGGNISDPLNLNSLQDEDINRAMNAVTPKSSPLPTPPRHKAKIDVIIPPDIRDPLNLLNPLDSVEYEKRLETKKSRRGRKRCKSKRRSLEAANAPVGSPTQTSPVKESSTPMEAPSMEMPEASTSEPSTSGAVPPKDLKLDLHIARGHKRTASESEGSAKGKDKKARRMDFLDKIVSPVIPQPGAWMRVHPRGGGHAGRGGSRGHQGKARASVSKANAGINYKPNTVETPLPKFKSSDARYQYGNYDRYYGYRNLDAMIDIRLKVFGLNRHLFNNKDILDIGCNVGHISIAVARDLGAKSVTGIDIDKNLIARARKNIKEHVLVPPPGNTPPKQEDSTIEANEGIQPEESTVKELCVEDVKESMETSETIPENVSDTVIQENVAEASTSSDPQTKAIVHQLSHRHTKKFKRNRRSHHKHGQDAPKCHFPISCPILYGPLEAIGYNLAGNQHGFPHNIVFKQANYVLKDENLIMAEPSHYDLILCLSITKWIHLNWGDAGLKLAFKRMFAQLRPGGKLILEAQNWASYKKKKKLTETIYKNFMAIEFFPNKFREYLLSPEVGFSKCCVLGVPQHLSKGFRRPIHLFIKGDFTPSKVQWSDTYAPSSHHQTDSNIENQPKKVYVNAFSPIYNPSNDFWGTNTPLYGAATPYSPRLENNVVEESPFYNPRSDSYLPSYTSSGQTKTVYASLSSPQSDYGGTPVHVSEGAINQTPHGGVYATLPSPASPFLEPSPGNSGTPSHPFTPSHGASCDAQPSRKVYASLHSPQEESSGPPVYSPSVAHPARRAAPCYSPLHTGPTCTLLDPDNTNSSDLSEYLQAKGSFEHFTPATSPAREACPVQESSCSAHQSPKDQPTDGD